MGLALPDELIGLTFNHLDVPSLLRCMQVCKLFNAIISGSTHMIYKIELFASCMEDNEHSSIDTLSRLNLLREHSRVWNNMSWPSSGTIPMRDGNCWEFSGGVLAQSTRQNELFLVQLPCNLKGIPERRWSVPFEFRIREFTLDNSQDLIVLLELVGNPPNMTCRIHLRTLSGEHHPRATLVQIAPAVPNLRADFTFLIQICGNRVAVLFYDQIGATSHNSFLVWNWRTGCLEVYIHIPEFQSFAFMTEDLILAAILRADRELSLQVLNIAAFVGPIHSLLDMPYVCELLYPELRANVGYVLIRSDPTPAWRPPAGSGVPFHGSRKDFIFTISMRTLRNETHESTVLFVPLSILLAQVEHSHNIPHRHVPWDVWGPNGTRIISREPSETWVCYTYGMKFIQGLRWKNGHVARAYDFNPYAANKDVKTSTHSPIPWTRLAKQSRPGAQCQSFNKGVVTSLPGRIARVSLAHSDDGWDAVMIGEDHILMVQPNYPVYGYMAM